jgi:hypothetical protein
LRCIQGCEIRRLVETFEERESFGRDCLRDLCDRSVRMREVVGLLTKTYSVGENDIVGWDIKRLNQSLEIEHACGESGLVKKGPTQEIVDRFPVEETAANRKFG